MVAAALAAGLTAGSWPAFAQISATQPRAPKVKADPLEGLNRSIFAFNEAVDLALLKPLATAYRKVIPSPVRTGVDNVFGNVGDAWSAVNHLLQGKVQTAVEMTVRVTTNSLFGLGGLFLGEQLGQIGISLIFILILLLRPTGLFGGRR